MSSLGHSVLVPAWVGGGWHTLVTQSSQASSEASFYLAFIVALHCATALALLWFFRADWFRIIRGFLRSLPDSYRSRRIVAPDPDARLGWMIVLATIPVGITGVALEHTFRTIFAKPVAAAAFLIVNGVLLLAGERIRRRSAVGPRDGTTPTTAHAQATAPAAPADLSAARAFQSRTREERRAARASDHRIARLGFGDAFYVGVLQIGALLAGISRSGITMVGGLRRGLDHEDSARFAFLLATPPILAAGVLKLPTLAGSAGAHIHGQVVVGMIVTGVAAYLSVKYLVRYFQTRTLTPFAVYCLVAGSISLLRFAL